MVETSLESLLADYDAQVEIAVDLAPRVSSLITDLLRDSSLRAHSVSARVKTRESMARKLSERNPPYSHLDEITDVIGIRIITYFDDDVDLVASTIEANFDVDADNSVDKRSLLEPDRFGYLSVHYVATLSETRASLREWARFADRKFEIQIRSILQHAWAEIEHDLGYKSAIAVPGHLRRRFSRLAGLLEVADEEFTRIRDDLHSYSADAIGAVISDPRSLAIDQASLVAYVTESQRVLTLDSQVAAAAGVSIGPLTPQYMGWRVPELVALGLVTIADVDVELEQRATLIRNFTDAFVTDGTEEDTVPRGIALFYLFMLMMAERGHLKQQLPDGSRLSAGLLRRAKHAYTIATATVAAEG